MMIVNVSPDSFSDGGPWDETRRTELEDAWNVGVRLFDVGGESTRPGHTPVDALTEILRVVPAIRSIRSWLPDAWISIDSQKPVVASAALLAGADFVNDVNGARDKDMRRLVRKQGCSIVVMRRDSLEGEVIAATRQQLHALVDACLADGIDASRIIVDPGLGFGDRPGADPELNVSLIDDQTYSDYPILIGASRKRFVGALDGNQDPKMRDAKSHELALLALQQGALIVRVHDPVGLSQCV